MMSSVTGGCPLALVILLLVCIDPTATEVVKSVRDCDEFFLEKTPPEIKDKLKDGKIEDQNRYKPICQEYGTARRFMTLYDTENKIPVFSAYKYTGHETCKNEYWRIEKKLDKKEQAKDDDYKNNGQYDRGHMFPCLLANTEEDRISTYTLTNAVPQVASFNKGSWKKLEAHLKVLMDKQCEVSTDKIEAYVLTGAIPNTKKVVMNGVNVPETLWTAFCCYNHEGKQWYAGAYKAANNEKGTIENITFEKLLADVGVNPFPKQCVKPNLSDFEMVASKTGDKRKDKADLKEEEKKVPKKIIKKM